MLLHVDFLYRLKWKFKLLPASWPTRSRLCSVYNTMQKHLLNGHKQKINPKTSLLISTPVHGLWFRRNLQTNASDKSVWQRICINIGVLADYADYRSRNQWCESHKFDNVNVRVQVKHFGNKLFALLSPSIKIIRSNHRKFNYATSTDRGVPTSYQSKKRYSRIISITPLINRGVTLFANLTLTA